MLKSNNLLGAFFSALLFVSCNSNENKNTTNKKDFIGKTYSLDAFHRIQFKTDTRYWIYQKPLNCGGEGNWSFENGKITLGPNDSNCESTRNMAGSYENSKFN